MLNIARTNVPDANFFTVDEFFNENLDCSGATKICCKGAPIACDARGIATTTLVVRVVLKLD